MLASSGHPDCAKIVNPIDAPPTRSPLQVHTALARRFSGLSVIEVGTRNGDGAECWASAASKLYAVEMDHKYCGILRARSSKLPRGFEVLCTKFARIPPEILLSADYFTCAQPAASRPRPSPAAETKCFRLRLARDRVGGRRDQFHVPQLVGQPREACAAQARQHGRMVKVQSGPSSAPLPPQGTHSGSRQLGTPRKRPAHSAPRHCLRYSNQPPQNPLISPPFTIQAWPPSCSTPGTIAT